MITFDGTSREVCQIRRIRTNTPLQALVTLNDPVFLEAAGAVAASVDGDSDPITRMFRRVLVRTPTAQETAALREIFDAADAEFAANQTARDRFLSETGQTNIQDDVRQRRAVLTVVASVLLNLDETLMKP